ncbi:probable E3 ubiquitin-protein ligase XBOS32 isoform X2 [Physcomitrium patens]|uniref:RING-type E3 ubiquitin transferase n=1 Tax=Physcomitrium patens TaxID=3218 RepID=A0A7I4DK85_PHYPA|nr:probable E3 ubiquitin-protein ligase XBOS32 isoform X2 [Physcomitrium patens]|eukprot:XP_024374149.1 probable E3 ubiquitin-protein ligase XBOS32 isoform X2 [Physcomitrella patens]
MGNSFGCSASGERLVSAARDGDLQEAQALLECNPRLAKYSTFGVRNSPLHFSAMQGHNEIVTLLLECGVEVNTRNYCGQTALMQACRYGHWEVVQTLLLYRANVNRADYLNGRTALHFAAVSGHSRSLARVVNRAADGGITSLHMAALNCHTECLQLLLDLSANVNAVTIQDGTTIDLIGAGSAPLHYAACGGSIPCCQALIAKGASRIATNCNGWTPLQVARLLRRHWLEPLLIPDSSIPVQPLPPSRYLALPLSSIMKIARDCGWRIVDPAPVDADPCSVCLERRCTVAAEGCGHELCTRCALYLCSTNIIATATSSPPGAIPCPLCRHGIVSFVKLPTTMSLKDLAKMNLASLTLCTTCTMEIPELNSARALLHKGENRGGCRVSPLSIHSLRLTCPGFSSLNCPGGFGSNDENSGCTSPAVTCGFARSDSRSEVRTDDPTTIETLAWPLPSRVSILRTTPVVAANTLPVQPPNNDGVPSTSKPAPQRDYSSPKVTTRRWLREPFRWSNYASLRSQRN